MSTEINYINFQPDWWDTLDINAEIIQASIQQSLDEAFGHYGIPLIQKIAIADAAFRTRGRSC